MTGDNLRHIVRAVDNSVVKIFRPRFAPNIFGKYRNGIMRDSAHTELLSGKYYRFCAEMFVASRYEAIKLVENVGRALIILVIAK